MPTPTKLSDTASRGKEEKDRLARQAQVQARSNRLTPIKTYLIAYNGVSLLLWSYVLVLVLSFLLTPRTPTVAQVVASPSIWSRWFTSTAQSAVGIQPALLDKIIAHLSGSYDFHYLGIKIKWIQSLAVLDIINAALGLVRSSPTTVLFQVASRLWSVWGIVDPVPATRQNPLYTTMVLAWSIAEVMRYGFYLATLLGVNIPLLNWFRYNAFILLYPIGASSEAFLSFSTIPKIRTFRLPSAFGPLSSVASLLTKLPASIRSRLLGSSIGRAILWRVTKSAIEAKGVTQWTWIEVTRLVLFLGWWPALYILMSHMFHQRRKYMSKNRAAKAKTQ